ncbi:MAG: ATP-binding protein [Alphaproteobacteria bacterium]|nr:ATP-binding protein [Alphaproteobacteria bacterium]
MRFYDREQEIELLKNSELQANDNAMFTVVSGRRRIGKTSLILKSLEGKTFVYLFVARMSEAMLCQKFQTEIESTLNLQIYGNVDNFNDLFEILMRESLTRHFTVVIDEIQNFYRINAAVFSHIQNIWDRYHRESRINLIVCGSVRSLMVKIFENQNEPLYGRATAKLMLKPFRPSVMKQILQDYNPTFTPDDLLAFYTITGGVAKYAELLIDYKCFTKNKMLDFVTKPDSYFITEGKDLTINEFSNDYDNYFSILQLISTGHSSQTQIDGVLQKNTGAYLNNLEKNYGLIEKSKPMFAKSGTRLTKYSIKDNFLRFWFRFIYPYQNLIESGQWKMLRTHIENNFNEFSGQALERYFRESLMETEQFTTIGNWWDKNSENEIDIIAVNEFENTGTIAEVKRNAQKISLGLLKQKSERLPKEFSKYNFNFVGLSLNDM